MRNRWMGLILAVAAVLALSPGILAQTAPPSEGAKATAASPKPDLSGVWNPRRGGGDGIPGFGFTSEEPSMQPWAAEKYKAIREGATRPNDKGRDEWDPTLHCVTYGPTRPFTVNHPFEIAQVPGRVFILFESDHLVRRIFTDGRKHPPDPDPTFMGHSIGSWDGDTLVVDTVGLNDLTWIDTIGHLHSDALHVVERIRRVDHDTLEINFLFDDPKAYTKSWTGKKSFRLMPVEVEEQVICEDHVRGYHVPKLLHGIKE